MDTKLPKIAITEVFCGSFKRYFHSFPKHAGKIVSTIYMSKFAPVSNGTHVSAVVGMVHFEVNFVLLLLTINYT